jgi:catechol 2,3-dioxygenase-like lactoylglutathione lyase family enzyme
MIEGISAVTLGTHEMPRAVRFYRALGFEVLHGGEESSFTSFRAGTSYLNLIAQPAERRWSWWGRVIFYVADVDALYDRALVAGYQPATVPHDAEWGERFFHLVNPTATNSVSLGLCSRFPSNSRSKRPAIPRGAGRVYGAPIIR